MVLLTAKPSAQNNCGNMLTNKARSRRNNGFWFSLVSGEVVKAKATVQRLATITLPILPFVKEATKTEGIAGELTADHVAMTGA